MAMQVDQRRCPQNHRCPMMRICPTGAIHQEGYGLPMIDKNLCTECGACVKMCPMKAVKKGIELD